MRLLRRPSPLLLAALLGTTATAQNPFGTQEPPAKNPFDAAPPANNPAENNPFESVPPAAPAAAPSRIVMSLHTFTDPKSNNAATHTALVPEGWSAEGGVYWADPRQFAALLPSQNIRISAPDGRMVYVQPNVQAVDFLPSLEAQQNVGARRPAPGTPQSGLPTVYMPQNAEEWRQMIERSVRADYPNATDVSVDPVELAPELDKVIQEIVGPLRQMVQQSNQQMAGSGFGSDIGGNGLSALAHFTIDGRRYDQLNVWATLWNRGDNPAGTEFKWSIEPSVCYRAPAGRLTLELPMLLAIAQSVRPTPEFARARARLAQSLNAMQRQAIEQSSNAFTETMRRGHAARMGDIAAKGQQIAARGAEIANMYNTTNANSGNDKGHESFIKAIREVTDYKSEDGSAPSVQLPSHYDHIYGSPNGKYILTNDGNFNPNLDPAFNQNTRWGEMTEIK